MWLINFDDSVKNRYVLALLVRLVELNVFNEIHVDCLIKGHTGMWKYWISWKVDSTNISHMDFSYIYHVFGKKCLMFLKFLPDLLPIKLFTKYLTFIVP